MINEDIIKSKIDLKAASALLNEVLEKEKEKVNYNANNKTFLGQALLEKEQERCTVLATCKDNLEFVIGVLDEYINQESIQSNIMYSYRPRKLTFHSDLGKYQTEVIKAKKKFETLHWAVSMTGDAEKKALYQECISKLNYVYSHIAKRV